MTWGDGMLVMGLLGLIAGGVWIAPRTPRLAAIVQGVGSWLLAVYLAILIETWLWPPMVGPYFEDGWMSLQRGMVFSAMAIPLMCLFLVVIHALTRWRMYRCPDASSSAVT
jgi:hypothetical protein